MTACTYQDLHNFALFSPEEGGSLLRWKYRGVDILSPDHTAIVGNESKKRGGMPLCFPFGTTDPRYDLPKHGLLRHTPASVTRIDGVIIASPNLFGPRKASWCRVETRMRSEPNGLSFVLSVLLLDEPLEPIYANAGLHPYFRLPEGRMRVTIAGKSKEDEPAAKHVYQNLPDAETFDNHGRAEVVIPGLGTVTMTTIGNAWKRAARPRFVLWTDNVREYACVEPVLGMGSDYGTSACPRLKVGETLSIRCRFEVELGKF